MVESVGKKLHQARVQRGLTIDEAAHATRLRPDKIAALEGDDYATFASNAYAKGFLQIYARFLKVDVSEFVRSLESANPLSVSDYQYLTNAPANRRDPNPVRIEERRAPSLAPLFFFIVLIVLGLGISWLWTTYQRVQNEQSQKGTGSELATPNPDADFIADAPPAGATPLPATTPIVSSSPAVAAPAVPTADPTSPAQSTPSTRVAPAPPRPVASPAPVVVAASSRPVTSGPFPSAPFTPAPAAPLARATPPLGTPTLTATPPPIGTSTAAGATPPPRGLESDFVSPAPVAAGTPPARPNGANEILVAAVKKTWVTVRRDDPKAQPIFEDYVYPNANPLKLRGARFYIEARDPAAVQITKNGLPIPNQPPGVPVE